MSMSILQDSNEKRRLYLRFRTSNVPGEAGKRNIVLTKDCCPQLIGREFNKETDYVYVPAVFDMPNRVTCLIFDFNIGQKGIELDQIPISCYKVSYCNNIA
jgi:hypothetical protein